MGRQPSEIAQQVATAIQGDGEATRLIAEALQSRDPERIKTVLKERAGVEVSDEEMSAALNESDEVLAYYT